MYNANRCPPINILLNPDQAETDEHRQKMDEHLKSCKDCQQLVDAAGGQHRAAVLNVETKQLDKLMREIAHTIVHLYRCGYPKHFMIAKPNALSELIYQMLSHQDTVMNSIGDLQHVEEEEIMELWLATVKVALMVLVSATDSGVRVVRPHHAWKDCAEDFRTLIKRFTGPCQNVPKRKRKEPKCSSSRKHSVN